MQPELTLSDWSFEPTVLAGLVLLVVAYVLIRRRGWLAPGDDLEAWGIGTGARAVLFGLGVLVAFLALCSPIDAGGDEYLFSIHMVQHLLLMMVAPPLLLLGIAGLHLPREAWESRGGRIWRTLTRPWTAVFIFNGVLLVWHIPALYDTTLRVLPVHIIEHFTFIAAGIVFWWPIAEPVRATGAPGVSPLRKVAMLTVSGVPATILGLLFSLAGHPFYDFYAQAPRLWGISAVTDQQWAGAVMFGAGNVIFFVPISIIFLRMFGDPAADEAEVIGSVMGRAGAGPAGDVSGGRSRTI